MPTPKEWFTTGKKVREILDRVESLAKECPHTEKNYTALGIGGQAIINVHCRSCGEFLGRMS